MKEKRDMILYCASIKWSRMCQPHSPLPPAQHSFWSQAFFVLNLAVLILANTSLITHPNFIKPIGYYGYAVAAINLTLVLISMTPLIEWLTVFTALAYAGLLAYNTFKLYDPQLSDTVRGFLKLHVREPVSGGILLSYKCTSECRHCMYACSPRWKADWMPQKDLERILTQLSDRIQPSPLGPNRIDINYGLHFTGGEPFLNFDLLVKAVEMAHELRIPSTFVETNSFWCTSDETTKEKLTRLRDAGLHGLLISVNPFIIEQVPFERTERAIRVGREFFGENAIVYQEVFYERFRSLNLNCTFPFDEYLRTNPTGLAYAELLPMGRAVYKLEHLYTKYPAKQFFGESCTEALARGWHIHVDNYCNYMTGYCGGISMGDARDIDLISQGIDLSKRSILSALVRDLKRLFELGVERFDYKELRGGYISKCHLCLDVRKHIAQKTNEFEELGPREFYYRL